MSSKPVLQVPDFCEQFSLMVDASNFGAGAALMQVDEKRIEHPVSYFSCKFNQHQVNYSTIEKEALALLLTLQHFDVYLNTMLHPIIVYTDLNPLVFVNKTKKLQPNDYKVCYTSCTIRRSATFEEETMSKQMLCPGFEFMLRCKSELCLHILIVSK